MTDINFWKESQKNRRLDEFGGEDDDVKSNNHH